MSLPYSRVRKNYEVPFPRALKVSTQLIYLKSTAALMKMVTMGWTQFSICSISSRMCLHVKQTAKDLFHWLRSSHTSQINNTITVVNDTSCNTTLKSRTPNVIVNFSISTKLFMIKIQTFRSREKPEPAWRINQFSVDSSLFAYRDSFF